MTKTYGSIALAGTGVLLCLMLAGGVVAQRTRLGDGGKDSSPKPRIMDAALPPVSEPGAAPDPASQAAQRLAHLAGTLRRFDLVRNTRDATAALGLWHEAYVEAMWIPRWEALADVGDAALSLQELTPAASYQRFARAAYVKALIRARDQRSLGGVLRVARGFAVLGDQAVVEHSLQIADALAGYDPARRDQLREFVESLASGVDVSTRTLRPSDATPALSPRLEP